MTTMTHIRDTLGALHNDSITPMDAAEIIAELSKEELAEFIVDFYERGIITNWNIGLDQDGDPI